MRRRPVRPVGSPPAPRLSRRLRALCKAKPPWCSLQTPSRSRESLRCAPLLSGDQDSSEMSDAPAAATVAEPLPVVAEEVEGEGEASTTTMERVAASKKFIENHYRSHMKNIQERKER